MYIQSYFFLGHTIKNSVVSMVASLVGMIPEGLYLLASVALVVSVRRLAGKSVLVHEMNCVETLARVNVLCVDKTGTITRPEMSVSDVVFCRDNVTAIIADVAGNMSGDNETMKAVKEYFSGHNDKKAYIHFHHRISIVVQLLMANVMFLEHLSMFFLTSMMIILIYMTGIQTGESVYLFLVNV